MDEEQERKKREFLQKLFDPRPDPDIDFIPGLSGCAYCEYPFKIDSEVSTCPMCELACHWPYCIKIHVTGICEKLRWVRRTA